MNLPELNQENFGLIKLSGFAICFFVAAAAQFLFPYKKMNLQILKNWRVNLPLALLNTGLFSLFCVSCACAWSLQLKSMHIGLFNQFTWPVWLTAVLSIFILDFVAYAWHRLNHKYPLLWRFHSVHHSDRVFDASTALRFHFGELLFSLALRLAMVSVFGLSIADLLIFELVFQFFNLIIHGNIKLPLRFEKMASIILVTPVHHRKHHSLKLKEINSNFGTIFSFWDRVGASYKASQSSEVIEVGIPNLSERSLLQAVLLPFQKAQP